MHDLILKCIAAAIFAAFGIRGALLASRKRQRAHEAQNAALRARRKYVIRPITTNENQYSFEEFQELLKIYSCSSDNGTGYWASSEGAWFDLESDSMILVCPNNVRKGERPEAFFTHILYYGK